VSIAAVLIQEFVSDLLNLILLFGLGMATDVLPRLHGYIRSLGIYWRDTRVLCKQAMYSKTRGEWELAEGRYCGACLEYVKQRNEKLVYN